MRTVRRKIKDNKIERDCESILRIALNPNQITDTFAAIREINTAISGIFN